jgi:hypothetical protein
MKVDCRTNPRCLKTRTIGAEMQRMPEPYLISAAAAAVVIDEKEDLQFCNDPW